MFLVYPGLGKDPARRPAGHRPVVSRAVNAARFGPGQPALHPRRLSSLKGRTIADFEILRTHPKGVFAKFPNPELELGGKIPRICIWNLSHSPKEFPKFQNFAKLQIPPRHKRHAIGFADLVNFDAD